MIGKTLLCSLIVNMFPRGTDEGENNSRSVRGGSVDRSSASENDFLRNTTGSNLWRPSSLANLVMPRRRKDGGIFESSSMTSTSSSPEPPSPSISTASSNDSGKKTPKINGAFALLKSDKKNKLQSLKQSVGNRSTIVSIVLVEAKGLPNSPTDGSSHGLYCKIRLGSQKAKSKPVQNLLQPVWRERFHMHLCNDHVLSVSLWDKGKQKTFMGSAVLDLSQLERERTHEIWQQLDNGYGVVHLLVTLCNTRRRHHIDVKDSEVNLQEEKNVPLSPSIDWKLVGQLFVRVVSAKGLVGKPSAYCSLEVDNERVRTHTVRANAEPAWNKNFAFNVYDVTSTLDLKINDTSLMSESLGRISIPLLRIRNGETKWYALKDKSNRHGAKGNCPRVLLEMSLFWNPMKASLRVFQPREVKYIEKSQKFDITLVYKNMEFVRDLFVFVMKINDGYKRLFEWESHEMCVAALSGWLLFWYHFRLWATPLIILVPFIYFWITNKHHEQSFMRGYGIVENLDKVPNTSLDKIKTQKSLTERLQGFPEMTLTITSSIEYIAALFEKLYNLVSFKVPFLSYLTMFLLIIASIAFYIVPFNYLMMLFGIYKFSRNFLRSEKVLNNELEGFISRIPDTEALRDWKELNVPEPTPINGMNVGPHPYFNRDSVMY